MYRNTIFIIVIVIFFSSCYKYPDSEYYDYETFNRVMGPEGGIINFFENYENDSIKDVVIKLEIPEGALDSFVVFNMYKTGNYEIATELDNGFAKIGTEFVYFVPFYKSQGYHEHDQIDVSYHLSIDFNEPVKVTYNYLVGQEDFNTNNIDDIKLYYEYYKATNNSFKLYRIKIPKTDEWGQQNNIRINWNSQGYPVGYNQTDIEYIINGNWSQSNEWGSEIQSLENWEVVEDVEVNSTKGFVRFDINNTDYIYLLAKKTQIDTENLPNKVQTYLTTKYPNVAIYRAAINNGEIVVYMTNGYFIYFNKKGEMLRLMRQDINYSEIPSEIDKTAILYFLSTNYENENIKKISFIQYGSEFPDYFLKVTLSSEVTIIFNAVGEVIGTYDYGVDLATIPQVVFDYVAENHVGTNIINACFDSMDGANKYIIYLSDNTKLYFTPNGTWLLSLYYNIPMGDLPEGIKNYLETNFSDIDVAFSVRIVRQDSEEYQIALLNATQILFDQNAEITELYQMFFEEDDLPQEVKDVLAGNYSDLLVSEISYYYNSAYTEIPKIYDIYFEGNFNIELEPDGNINYLYGTRFENLAQPVKNYLLANYAGNNIIEYEMFVDDSIYNQKMLYVLLQSGIYVVFDENGNFIEEFGGFKNNKRHKIKRNKINNSK